MLRRRGIPAPDRVISTSSVLVSLALAARMDAVVPVAAPIAALFGKSGGFIVLPLEERIVVEPFGLIRLRDRALSPAAKLCYEAVKDAALRRK